MTGKQTVLNFRGHRPEVFGGQRKAILDALLERRGEWIPSFVLAGIALQYSARVRELRNAGYTIENRTQRVGRQVHGSFRLVACPDAAAVNHG